MSSFLINEQIKASEVQLIGIENENLGVLSTKEALLIAKQHKVDLVCINLMQSPPLCQLIARGKAKQQRDQKKAAEQSNKKMKEIRLTPQIEEHDLHTKQEQAAKLLGAGHPVLLVFKVQGKDSKLAKQLLEQIVNELKPVGKLQGGIQMSGKQVAVTLEPIF